MAQRSKKTELNYSDSLIKTNRLLQNYFQTETNFSKSDWNHIFNELPLITCVINFSTKTYEYVSDNFNEIFGVDSFSLMREGLPLGIKLFEPSEREIFVEKVLPAQFELMKQYVERGKDAKNIKISYHIGMVDINGQIRDTFHIIIPITTDASNMPILCLKYVYVSSGRNLERKLDLRLEYKEGKDNYETVFFQTYHSGPKSENDLTLREVEVLKLIQLGKSSREIADFLHISINTVNNHRKNILKKTNSKNIHQVNIKAELL